MVKSLLAVLLLGACATAADAVDVKDLEPCKPAAQRYCDHSDTQVSMTNIIRCGATLAAISHRVGEPCRVVCGATVSSDVERYDVLPVSPRLRGGFSLRGL